MEESVEELRKKVAPHLEKELSNVKITDTTLRRYLKGNGLSVQLAYQKLLETSAWRREYRVEAINADMTGVRKHLADKKCLILNAQDLQGRPILYVVCRNHSMYNRNMDEATQFIVYILELVCKQHNDKEGIGACVVFDMKKFRMSSMDYPLVRTLLATLTSHYPELMNLCLIVDSPFFFYACWTIIRHWMDDNMRNKIKFVSSSDIPSFFDPKAIPDEVRG